MEVDRFLNQCMIMGIKNTTVMPQARGTAYCEPRCNGTCDGGAL
ncbi:MAG: hypothetical protein V8Q37_06385 [Angelakisella sp.]